MKDRLSTPTSPTGLAWMRIVVSLVILGEVLQIAALQDLIVEGDPGLRTSPVPFAIAVWVWVPALCMMVVGWHGRKAAVVNFVCTWFTFGVTTQFEYHADYSYSGVALFFLIAPVFEVWSVDNLRRSLQDPTRALEGRAPTIPSAWVYALLVLGIGLVYIDSVVWKFASTMWITGLGMWLPMSLPSATWLPAWLLQPLLDQHWFVAGAGYLTLVFEALFLILIWWRQTHPVLLVVGIALHLGIVAAFPIPFFGVLMSAFYLVLVPDSWWRALAEKLRSDPANAEEFVVDRNDAVQLRRAVLLRSLDLRGAVAIRLADRAPQSSDAFAHQLGRTALGALVGQAAVAAWLSRLCADETTVARSRLDRHTQSTSLPIWMMVGASFVQLNFIAFSGPASAGWQHIGAPEVVMAASRPIAIMRTLTRPLAGLTPHSLFTDAHLRGYNHIIGLVHVSKLGEETWLPLITPEGRTSYWVSGRTWAFWSFRVCNGEMHRATLGRGVARIAAVWAVDRGLLLDDLTFRVVAKKVRLPVAWEPQLLTKNSQSPWLEAGRFGWKSGQPFSTVVDIERL